MKVYCIYIRAHYWRKGKAELPFGIAYISSSLKNAGYAVETVFMPFVSIKEFIKRFDDNAKIVGISIATKYDCWYAEELAAAIKARNSAVKIITGGAYPTLMSEYVIKNGNIDAVCIGEGEIAVTEYAKQVETGEFKPTDNLLIKTNGGGIITTGVNRLIEDIDNLPYPDRTGWNKYTVESKKQKILLQRGCKNKCTHCSNHALRRLSTGKYERRRNIDLVMKELDYICGSYKDIEIIFFEAENSFTDINYFKALCRRLIEYNKNLKKKLAFDIKFNFNDVMSDVNDELPALLKEANVIGLNFGIESGSLEIRNRLNRPYYTNAEIIKFCDKLRGKNINFATFVMYCFPFETEKTYNETIELLRRCKPHKVLLSWLTPFENTEFCEVFNKENKKVGFADAYNFLMMKFRVYRTYKNFVRAFFDSFNKVHMFIFLGLVKGLIAKKIYEMKLEAADKYIAGIKAELDKGNFKKAVKMFEKIRQTTDKFWLYGDIAIAEMKIGEYEKAEADFNKVMEYAPNDTYRQKREECFRLAGNKAK